MTNDLPLLKDDFNSFRLELFGEYGTLLLGHLEHLPW